MSHDRILIAIVSFCVAMTGIILANLFLTMMIGEINRTRKDGALVSYFGFTFPKVQRIFREYRLSYPIGRLHVCALAAFCAAVIGLISMVISLHILG